MEIYTTYILYSVEIKRYYVGSTSMNLYERLKRHNTNHSGFTGKTNDWKVVFSIEFETVSESRLLEKKIKSRGAQRFLHL